MSIVQQKKKEEIAEDILNTIAAERGITDRELGANVRTEVNAIAEEIDGTYYQEWRLERGFYIETATGDELDKKGADFGLTRKAAVAAIGSVDITVSGATTIPAGSLFAAPALTTRDEVQFETLSALTPGSAGSYSVAVRCTQTGVVGNLAAGQITKIVNPIANVTAVTNPGATTLGAAQEDDDTFRARIRRTIDGLSRCTAASILSAALDFAPQSLTLAVSMDNSQTYMEVSEDLNTVPIATSGTLALNNYTEIVSYTGIDTTTDPQRITGLTRGVSPSSATTHTAGIQIDEYVPSGRGREIVNAVVQESPGVVDVYVDDGTTTGTSSELLALVTSFLQGDGTTRYEGYKAAGITLNGFSQSLLTVSVTAVIVVETGYSSATVLSDAQTAVTNLLNTWRNRALYGSVVLSAIEETLGVAGVVSFSMTDGVSTVGATGLLAVASTQVVRSGTITIT